MNGLFQNQTVRSASDLLADLSACRQLRHVGLQDKNDIVALFLKAPARGRTYARISEVFEHAFEVFGYVCDTCGENVNSNELDFPRRVSDRALSNLDGYVKLILCRYCSQKFSSFCVREFDREARMIHTPDLEGMMVAFIASEVMRVQKRIVCGLPPENMREQEHKTAANRKDR